MATDEERLIFLVEARVRDLERNMAKASSTTGREFNKMRRHSASATKQMEQDMVRSTNRINQALATTSTQIGQLGAAFGMGGLTAGLAFTGLLRNVQQTTEQIADMAAEAQRAGLSFKAFQELQYAASKSRVSVDALTDGIKEMQLRADEFIDTGKGSGAEAFAQLGFSATDLAERLKEPDRLFEEIIRRLGDLDKASQIRVADEIFGGTGGEQFIQMLDRGVDGIRDARREAHSLGIVLEDEIAEKARRVNERFDDIYATLTGRTNVALTNLGDIALNLADGPLGDLYDILTDLDAKAQSVFSFLSRFSLNDDIADWFLNGDDTEESEKPTQLPRVRTSSGESWRPLPSPSGGGRSSSAERMEKERQAVRELIAELEEELSLVNAGDRAKRAAEASRRAGAAATDEERKKIVALTEKIYQEEQALEKLEEARKDFTEGMDQLSTDALDALGNVIAGTEDAADAFKKLAIEIVKSAITGKGAYSDLFASLNTGGGGIGGLLGGIFGGFKPNTTYGSFIGAPGYSMGTANTGGRRGEPRGIVHGQEAIIPLPSGGRVPVEVRGGAAQAVPQRMKVDVAVKVSVDENGNLQGFVRNIAQREVGNGINQFDAGLPDRIQQIERFPRRR